MIVSVKSAMYVLLEARQPLAVKHCVAKVAKKYGGDVDRAFAICIAAKNKGDLKIRGKHKKDPKKLKAYERLLKKAKNARKK